MVLEILEKEMATHSSILAWKIPWMEEPGRLQYGVAKSRTRLSDFTSLEIREIQSVTKDESGPVRHCDGKITFICLALKGAQSHDSLNIYTSSLPFFQVPHVTGALELLCKFFIKPSSFWYHYPPPSFFWLLSLIFFLMGKSILWALFIILVFTTYG